MSTPSFNVTEEQLDRCHPILNQNTGELFYQVDSESRPGVTYEVHFIHGFTCTCPSGVNQFQKCVKFPTCKHCRWAVAHAERERACTSGERERHSPMLDAPLNGNRGFSLFR